MEIHCCYTPAHAVLYRDYFLPSLPDGLEVCATPLSISGSGDFRAAEYMDCLRRKIDLVIESIASRSGRIIIWSDVDILFFRPIRAELENLFTDGADLLYQRETADPRFGINGGFFACRCSAEVADFFRKVRKEMEVRPQEHDQDVINQFLREGGRLPIRLDFLPLTFSARTHGWPPPRDAVLYHANYTKGADGVGQKIRQFAEAERAIRGSNFQRWGTIARAAFGRGPRHLGETLLRRARLIR